MECLAQSDSMVGTAIHLLMSVRYVVQLIFAKSKCLLLASAQAFQNLEVHSALHRVDICSTRKAQWHVAGIRQTG